VTETAHNPDPIHQEALNLAAHGLHILPIKPGHKRPPMTAWQNAATTDPRTVDNWYTGLYRGHGIGIATGHDGLFVIDIDEHHPEASGHDTLAELTAEHGPLPDTWQVATGSGGTHLYYRAPHPISNDAGRKLGPGIDIRGTGGQVLAPPTLHPNGQPYTWIIGHEPDDLPLADAPNWLLALLTPQPAPAPTPTPRRNDFWDELDDSPAANYNNTHTWPELLTADGWQHDHTDRNGEQHWTRPGKDTGTSATLGYQGRDALTVFTSSLPWLPEGTYSRFGYYACRHHNGDRSAAARAIRNEISNTITLPPTEQICNGDEWPDPTPLNEPATVPNFPTHTLPTWITNYTQQIADNLQVATDLPNTLALGALSVCALGNTRIHYRRNNWTQPLNIYASVALPPSAGKSPAKAAMFAPLEQLEIRRLQQAQQNKHHNESTRRILDKRLRDLEEKLAKIPPGSDEALVTQHLLNDTISDLAEHAHTPSGRLLADDATTEALGVALAEAGGNIAVISSEGGIFDRMAGLYSEGQINLDLYLEAWSGGRYVVDRIKREPINIPSANLVVITTIQPHTLNEIGAKKAFAGRGLTARFLLCQPASNVGTRDRLRHSNADQHAQTTYEAHLTDIAETHHGKPRTLTLDPEADETFAHWDQALENRCGPGHELEHLNEWVGKLRANVIRLAGLLHLANHHDTDQVSPQTIQDAITLGDYYLAHMIAISDTWGVDETIIQARQILDWATRTNHTQFTIRDAMRANRRRFPDLDAIRGPLTILVENGWVRGADDGPITFNPQRGKPSPTLVIHPRAAEVIHRQNQVVGHVAGQTEVVPVVGHVGQENDPRNTTVTSSAIPVYKQCEVVGHVGHVAIRGEINHSLSLGKETSAPPTPCYMTDMTDNSPDPLDLLD
jgi:hypothetical protein